MSGASDVHDSSSLLSAPTWAITLTCTCFIVVSQAVERAIHLIGRRADKYNRAALRHAFERMKNELLMVGILSLALAAGQDLLGHVCIPVKWYTVGPLCKHPFKNKMASDVHETIHLQERQHLSAGSPSKCREGSVPFMTMGSVHDLHILVFILAAVHIAFSVMIITIGMWLVGRWNIWEDDVAGDPNEELHAEGGVRVTRLLTFIQERAPSECSANPFVAYVVAFFKQFYPNVSKADYTVLRRGFIKYHHISGFNFHEFIQRSFQEDLKLVVGISWKLWGYGIIWLLININGWEMKWLISCIPLLLVLVVGTKMQQIIIKMANEIQRQHVVVTGMPHVMPDDVYFWFGRPRFLLHCFHFIVFQNALATAYTIWAAVTFPSHNCLYREPAILVRGFVIGVGVQVIFGLLTLPVYALISQMGSTLGDKKMHDGYVVDGGSTSGQQQH